MARPAPSQRRPVMLAGMGVLVALLHAWFLAASSRPGTVPMPREVPPRGIVVVSRLAAVAPPQPAPANPATAEAAAPRAASVADVHAPVRALAPAAPPDRLPTPPPQSLPAEDVQAPTRATEPAPAPQRDDGEAPPVYPTRVPPAAVLRLAARINGVDGDAELRWQHDGRRYRLDLRVQGPARPLLEQHSEGGFDAAGLAPERFLDRRHGRTVGAAHFRHDIGRISFSGPPVDYPAWPGAQDRLAWLPQLVAVMAAAAEPPDELHFFVADARGIARAWVFRSQGTEDVASAAGPVRALKLLREPPRADDLRVTVWLDPATGYWPVRLAFVVPISGATFELTRTGFDPAAPLATGAAP